MSINFDVSGTNSVSFTAGSAGAVGTGARTIAALVRPKSGNNNAGFLGAYASGTVIVELFEDTLLLYGEGDFSSGFGVAGGNMSQDTWYVVALTHPGTSAPWRMHIWPYAADGSGTMSHGVAVGAGNHTNTGSAATELRIGSVDVKGNGDIAVAAYWTRECSDADLNGLKSNLLTAWSGIANGAPQELIHFQNWNGTSGAAVVVGTSTFSSQTGTSTAGAEPPSFSYTLTAAADASMAQRILPVSVLFEAAARWRTAWQQSDTQTIAASGGAAPVAHSVTAAAGTHGGAGAGSASARAVVATTGVKGAAAGAAPAAHNATAAAATKGTTGAASPLARSSTAAAAAKGATGAGATPVRALSTGAAAKGAAGVGALTSRASTAAGRASTAGTGAAATSARAVVQAGGGRGATGTATVATRMTLAAGGRKGGLVAASASQRAVSVAAATRGARGAGAVVARSSAVSAGAPGTAETALAGNVHGPPALVSGGVTVHTGTIAGAVT